VKGTEQGVWK